jgi:hypothetical protein
MKKQISMTVLGFFAVLVLAAAAANAQTTRGIEIQVPFDFVAGKKQLPAGNYTVRRARFDSESVLIIQGEGKGAGAAVVLTNTGEEDPARASLTFRQLGERYYLAEVSMPGTASVRELVRTGAERAAERELIEQAKAGASNQKTVTIAGSVR